MIGDLTQSMLNLAIVTCSAAALWPLWRMCATVDAEVGDLAAFGGGLMLFGGASLAVVRLAGALRWPPPLWLPTNLFGFLTPGFICLSYACLASQQILHSGRTLHPIWLPPLALIGAEKFFEVWLVGSIAPIPPQAMLILLTSLASAVLSGLCARAALRLRRPGLSSLFMLYILAVLAINLAARFNTTLLSIQLLNLLSNALLALACTRLYRATAQALAWRRQLRLLEA